jgi:ribosome biogenesis GTPase A
MYLDIQWYPGHMAKAKRLLGDKLKLINVAVIVVDARAPLSTFNPDLQNMLSGKQCIVVLNKADLADDAATYVWAEYYSKSHIAVTFSAISSKKGILLSAINKAAAPIVKKYADKGMRKTVRVLVCGIPNTGKSAIINRLIGRSGAKAGDRPGVTKGLQWLRLSDTLELLDSPGLLWPKIESEESAVNIALTGCLRQEITDTTALALKLITKLGAAAPGAVAARYGIPELQEDGDKKSEPIGVLKRLCIKRGFLLKEGEIDIERGAKALLDEFKGGKLGKITLERP